MLCYFYKWGKGVKQDFAQSYRWCRAAADQDDRDGQYILATLYMDGRGIEQNREQAYRWAAKAAGQGLAKADKLITEICAADPEACP
jgi:TPR repeat protein